MRKTQEGGECRNWDRDARDTTEKGKKHNFQRVFVCFESICKHQEDGRGTGKASLQAWPIDHASRRVPGCNLDDQISERERTRAERWSIHRWHTVSRWGKSDNGYDLQLGWQPAEGVQSSEACSRLRKGMKAHPLIHRQQTNRHSLYIPMDRRMQRRDFPMWCCTSAVNLISVNDMCVQRFLSRCVIY